MTPAGPKFTMRESQGTLLVGFTTADLLDGMYIKQLGDEIYHHIKEMTGVKLVLDFSNVRHLSSAALGMVIALHKVVTKQLDGELVVANISDDVHKVFKLMKLTKLVKIYQGTNDAVAALI